MSRTGVHTIIILCLMGVVYFIGRADGIDESLAAMESVGDSCLQILDEIKQKLDGVTDNG